MTLNVSLPKELLDYIDGEVDAGRFASPSELIDAAVRLLEMQDRRIDEDLDRLRSAWQKGVESEDFQPLDLDTIKSEGRRKLGL